MATLTPEAPRDVDIITRVGKDPSVVAGAKDAFAAGHNIVFSENLAIGAAKTDPIVSGALERQGVTVDAFGKAITAASGRDYNVHITYRAEPVYPPVTRHVLEASVGLADRSGSPWEGRHIFLSVLNEGNAAVEQAMSVLGIDAHRLVDELRQPPVDLLKAEGQDQQPPIVASMRGLLAELDGQNDAIVEEVTRYIEELRARLKAYKEKEAKEPVAAGR